MRSTLDWRVTLGAYLGMLLLVELLALVAGLKECGIHYPLIVFLFLAVNLYIRLPWVLLLMALIAISAGLLWRKRPLYLKAMWLLAAIALVALPIATYILVHSSGQECTL